jgi:hypothetical protein
MGVPVIIGAFMLPNSKIKLESVDAIFIDEAVSI